MDRLMQLMGSVITLLIGLALVFVLDLGPDAAVYQPYGWLLVAVGVLGLGLRYWLDQQRRRENGNRPDRRA